MGNFKCIFHRKIWRFIASFWLLLCCSQGANSADYYWLLNGSYNPHYLSAVAACDASLPALQASCTRAGYDVCEYLGPYFPSRPDLGYCRMKGTNTKNGATSFITSDIARMGDSCPPGTTYQPATGVCKGPDPSKCESSIGKVVVHQHNRGTLSEGGVILQNTLKEPPGVVCDGQCQYASTGEGPVDCYRFIGAGGDNNSAFCVFRYKGNGVECKAEDSAVASPPADLSPKREKKNECTNKVTDAEGRVHYSCLASDAMKEPGKMQCGEVNGVYGCIPGKPQPEAKTTEKKTDVTDAKASDGSSTTSTTTTTTTTTCNGVNACTTSTTVNNSSGKTNADGSDGGSSSSCTGPGCKKGDGTGEGSDEEKDPEEEKKEVSGEEACDVELSCSGDAIQCAMVRQQKKQRCDDQEFRKVDDKKIKETKDGIEGAFTGDDYKPLKPDESDGVLDMANLIKTDRHFSSACPTVPDWNIPWIDSKSVTIPISDVISQFCQYLAWFGYILVAFAMRGAAEIIARGLS